MLLSSLDTPNRSSQDEENEIGSFERILGSEEDRGVPL